MVLKLSMLTKDEVDYLNKIPKDKKIYIYPFDTKSVDTADEIIKSINSIYPDIEVKHMGASALRISGQKDLDIYAFSNPTNFGKYLPGLTKILGEPIHKHETFIEWGFDKNGFSVQFYLTQKDSPTMQKQFKVFEILKNNPDLLKEYENLKSSLNGKSFKEYQEKKYIFYHKILNQKIKAILFDMVGVLVFKKKNYVPKTKDEINTEEIEKLFNHVDDAKLIKDIKEKLKLSDSEIERAARVMPERFEKFNQLWKVLPILKRKYKLAVINNGNAVAKKYWDKKFGFKEFNIFVNSAIEGVKKPDLKIYLLTCKRLGVKPEECLFMDDTFENIEAAGKLGMETLWWDKEKEKRILLKEFMQKTWM